MVRYQRCESDGSYKYCDENQEILEMVKEGELKELIEEGKVLPTIIPDIESINYGRGVGYDIIEVVTYTTRNR